MADDSKRHELRTGFDQDPEAYQRTRPVPPPRLFDDLVSLAGLGPGDRLAEIGCGTGQATIPLAERGLTITAVELGAGLADIARRRLADFPSAEVATGSFEQWQPHGSFEAVVAVNSLHWIDPWLRYAKPASMLRPGGVMVVAGTQWARPPGTERFWAEVQQDYRAVGYQGDPPPPSEQIGAWHFPPAALEASLFQQAPSGDGGAHRVGRWQRAAAPGPMRLGRQRAAALAWLAPAGSAARRPRS